MKLKRDDCWMTFSEALEEYLKNRDMLTATNSLPTHKKCRENMAEAAAHMDALTTPEEEDDH